MVMKRSWSARPRGSRRARRRAPTRQRRMYVRACEPPPRDESQFEIAWQPAARSHAGVRRSADEARGRGGRWWKKPSGAFERLFTPDRLGRFRPNRGRGRNRRRRRGKWSRDAGGAVAEAVALRAGMSALRRHLVLAVMHHRHRHPVRAQRLEERAVVHGTRVRARRLGHRDHQPDGEEHARSAREEGEEPLHHEAESTRRGVERCRAHPERMSGNSPRMVHMTRMRAQVYRTRRGGSRTVASLIAHSHSDRN